MTHSTPKFARSARPTLLNAAVTAVFFLTLVMALYELDGQRYHSAKTVIVRENFDDIFNLPDTLRNYTHDAYYGAPDGREGALKSLRKEVAALLSGPTSIYRVTLTGPNGNLVFDEEQP
ncbi:MAG: hypothetical protein K1X53_06240, partial [Candidatus Sumerlaeaceae bacterium]|nr:hypothetical protein [Candidatus Sumerlaeaceae bacterium]